MKLNGKRRLAIFLSIMLILPTIMQVLPMTSTEVSAAATYTNIYSNIWNTPLVLEQGTKVELGNFVTVYTVKKEIFTYSMAKDVKAKYTSSDKSVATINNKGLVTAKKVGTTNITVAYKGNTVEIPLEVAPKNSFNKPAAVNALKKKAMAIKKGTPKKVTAGNMIKCLKLMNAYEEVVNKNSDVITTDGMLREKVTVSYGNGSYSYTTTTGKLAVPEAAYYTILRTKIDNFNSKYSPTSTRSSKTLKVKSVSGNTKAITVKFKKRVDADQIMAAKAGDGSYGSRTSSSKTKAYAFVNVTEVESGIYYRGRLEIHKGKNTGKVTLFKWDSAKGEYVSCKLISGKTYQLGYETDWVNKKVKVK